MGATRHPGWDSDWERLGSGSWRRVVRGADASGAIEYLSVGPDLEHDGWLWSHRGPDRRDPTIRHSAFKLHAKGYGFGTTPAAKRAADHYFADLLAACPCIDPMKYPEGMHSADEHKDDCSWARGAGPMGEACGGCWGCLRAQTAHHERLAEAER